mmetsp:Transcript_56097/g.177760  ORF Transcript_56097/g.177760 Transcript_56097/m.177760 type:complete len:111 (-) Transcript_56097:43-375(-)
MPGPAIPIAQYVGGAVGMAGVAWATFTLVSFNEIMKVQDGLQDPSQAAPTAKPVRTALQERGVQRQVSLKSGLDKQGMKVDSSGFGPADRNRRRKGKKGKKTPPGDEDES